MFMPLLFKRTVSSQPDALKPDGEKSWTTRHRDIWYAAMQGLVLGIISSRMPELRERYEGHFPLKGFAC
jgi:hypothetical protein